MTRASTIERRDARIRRTHTPPDDSIEVDGPAISAYQRYAPALDEVDVDDDAEPRWELYMRRAGIVFVVGLVLVMAIALRNASAQESIGPDDELALAVAKVAANEASLAEIEPVDVNLIWQVTETRASTTSDRLRWLRAHSSCVLTDRPLTEREALGNCRWSRGLNAEDTEPNGWPSILAWSRFRDRWAQVREHARRLVAGRPYDRPCPGRPFTWGSRTLDMARALELGLVPLGCRDDRGQPTRNEGFALGGRS